MSDEATNILSRLGEGDSGAAERLLPLIEDELRALAHRHLSREDPGHTLQTTLLVDEAFVRLINQRHHGQWRNRAHFFAVASRIIRRILVDHARKRKADKRGGDWRRIELDTAHAGAEERSAIDLLALEDALVRLHDIDERQARVVELRYFGGLTVEETAHVLGVSPRTVESDWAMARAWLKRELKDE